MTVSPELKNRVFAAVAAHPSPTRGQVQRARGWLWTCGVAGAIAIFLFNGGMRPSARPPSLVALTSVGTAIVVGLGSWLLFTPKRSLLGRPAWALLAIAAGCAIAFVAWRYGVSALYGRVEPWSTRPGFRCLGLGVATGALPLLAALLSWRRAVPASATATGAAFGAGAGLSSALLVDLWCPVSYLPHLLLGHLLPIAVLALVGGVAGSRMLRLCWR